LWKLVTSGMKPRFVATDNRLYEGKVCGNWQQLVLGRSLWTTGMRTGFILIYFKMPPTFTYSNFKELNYHEISRKLEIELWWSMNWLFHDCDGGKKQRGKNSCIFWDIMPRRPSKVNRRFGRTSRLNLQGQRIIWTRN
jgi:hypothetical protein